MNLARHAAVLWRFRAVTAAGLLLGIVLAILASYQVTTHGLVARGVSTYGSTSQLMITQEGCPECRTILPTGPQPGTPETSTDTAENPDKLAFADPVRYLALADLYTKLLVSDEVRARMPERPVQGQISASPVPAVSGAPILPIIELTTMAPTAEGATKLNVHAAEALRAQLRDEARKNDVAPDQVVQVKALNAPSPGAVVSGPSHTASVLALMLCLIGTIAVTHLLASLRPKHEPELDDSAFDWTFESPNGAHGEKPVKDDQLEGWVLPGRSASQ
jgi:hypothetical protein